MNPMLTASRCRWEKGWIRSRLKGKALGTILSSLLGNVGPVPGRGAGLWWRPVNHSEIADIGLAEIPSAYWLRR